MGKLENDDPNNADNMQKIARIIFSSDENMIEGYVLGLGKVYGLGKLLKDYKKLTSIGTDKSTDDPGTFAVFLQKSLYKTKLF